jgi:DNA-binding beta-propeller fold protein YncE
MESETKNTSWLDRSFIPFLPQLNIETILVILVFIVAVVSRFYNVDLRVMSHDEVNHVVPSYDLFRGRGYRHDPVTHGPMQFHLVALSYFLFGDNDLTSRLPAVLFSIATVMVAMLAFRRYIGRAGAVIAGVLFLISPYLLFYGRYTRNEAFVALFAVLIMYGILRYLEKGDRFSIYLLVVTTVLNFSTKETAYIYAAQFLLFVGFIFLDGVLRGEWKNNPLRNRFLIIVLVGAVLIGVALALGVLDGNLAKDLLKPEVTEDSQTLAPTPPMSIYRKSMLGCLVLGLAAIGLSIMTLIQGVGLNRIRKQRSFDLIILVGSLILPLLAAFPVKLIGWDPLDYTTTGIIRTGIVLVLLFGLSAVMGLWWKGRTWLAYAGLFYAIFLVLHTTFFTNGRGFFTGIVGGLGYWLAQQDVQRGSQPWYFYALVQLPIYEYLAVIGTFLAMYFGFRYRRLVTLPGFSPAQQPENVISGEIADTLSISQSDTPTIHEEELIPYAKTYVLDETPLEKPTVVSVPTLGLFLFMSLTGLVAYSIAGEKMPWLTVHIAVPMLLAAAWGIGYLVDKTPWKQLTHWKGLVAILLLPVFFAALSGVMSSFVSATPPPFQGKSLEQLEATSTFLLSVLGLASSGYGLFRLLWNWRPVDMLRLLIVAFFAGLAILTARTAATASYISYDNATEFLVYAHAARGPKDILAQVEEISRRTTMGKDIAVAYDNDALYPYWWYFRDYPNKFWFTDKPTRELREKPVIIAGEANFTKVDQIVKGDYIYYEYMRLWWPMQDYFGLTWKKVWDAAKDAKMRAALFEIWLNRDYSAYADITGSTSLTLETWQPANKIRLYIRKDIVGQIWDYGTAPAISQEAKVDPYEKGMLKLSADVVFGQMGSEPGMFNAPRGIAVAPDDSLYVADSRNHRIQHLGPDGQVLQVWGTFADASKGAAPGGTFNEPWGVAVGKDGSLFVTDTWNHRVQKFSADGQFLTMWGYFGQGEKPDAFWGPRGIQVDANGRVYVTDTGNKRVVIFDADGGYIMQFGTLGFEPGQFDEPVGIAINKVGDVFVMDTWNQRVQEMAPDNTGTIFTSIRSWEIDGWIGQSLDNKPFAAVDANDNVYVTDPEGYRVLVFDQNGTFLHGWGDASEGPDGFGLAAAVAVDAEGRVWVTDAGYNRIMRFSIP